MGKVIAFPAHRIQQPQVATATAPQFPPGLHGYCPEMGHAKPPCAFEATMSYGKYWTKVPPGTRLHGRGIKYIQTYEAKDLTPQAQHRIGWKVYELTIKAMEKLRQTHGVAVEILLD